MFFLDVPAYKGPDISFLEILPFIAIAVVVIVVSIIIFRPKK